MQVGEVGLTLIERLIALLRPNPEKRAERLRNRAENKRERAATAGTTKRRRKLLHRAGELEDQAEKLAPTTLAEPVAVNFNDDPNTAGA